MFFLLTLRYASSSVLRNSPLVHPQTLVYVCWCALGNCQMEDLQTLVYACWCALGNCHMEGLQTVVYACWCALGNCPVEDLRTEEHTSELQSHFQLVCRPRPEKYNIYIVLLRTHTPVLSSKQ